MITNGSYGCYELLSNFYLQNLVLSQPWKIIGLAVASLPASMQVLLLTAKYTIKTI